MTIKHENINLTSKGKYVLNSEYSPAILLLGKSLINPDRRLNNKEFKTVKIKITC